ncbi:MAG: phosphomannomutase/phosphoglucomutase [Patescibacteria group bacterium]|nr:phosphomannomutase/phosphoglucomutase [Patescibacteria group bacterium]
MAIDPKIFKAYDIRGIYPTEIDEEKMAIITNSIYAFFKEKIGKEKIKIATGMDMRTSSPSLFDVVKNTLVKNGAEVIDIGLASTPTFYFAVSHFGYDGGIQVSASHNPKEYNGLKFVINTPNGLIKIGGSTGMNRVKELSLETHTQKVETIGSITKNDEVLAAEVENAFKIVNPGEIKPFKIVADAANAMGSLYIDALFKRLPSTLVRMNFELDGTFPVHEPNPLKFETLEGLQKKVVEEKADLGIAPDGDGDRLFFIDEKGNIILATTITSIVAKELLRENKGESVLVDIRYILTPMKIIEEEGGKLEIVRVGHSFITEKMHETGGIFGGESSGHYFFRSTGNAESQLPMILYILKVMSREQKPISKIGEAVRRSFESGEINFKASNASEIKEVLKSQFAEGRLSELDGVSLSYPDWRFNVRTSNTEPLMRLNVEAYDENMMNQKKEELIEFINSKIKQ